MRTIHKFGPFRCGDENIEIWGRPIAFNEQNNGLYIWTEYDTIKYEECQEYAIVGTGWEIGDNQRQILTCFTNEGFVWHLIR